MRIDRRATQFVFAGIVRVEGRPPDIRLLADILDRDRRISALRDQGDERVLQQGARPRDAAVDRAHLSVRFSWPQSPSVHSSGHSFVRRPATPLLNMVFSMIREVQELNASSTTVI